METLKNKPRTVAIIGAGGRGVGFADLIRKFPKMAKVTAVAEVRDDRRAEFVKRHKIHTSMVFKDWRDFLKEKRTDAAVVSTNDREHAGPAIACLNLGMDILLEKPMSPDLAECEAIAEAQRKSGRVVTVCHSMRYHKGFRRVKELLDGGAVGEIVTLDQLEQVAYWHYAHSFVRGNWANEGRSSFMLLAKSCHDIDYITYLLGKDCRKVSSFGSLNYFKRENAPEGSTERCTDGCKVEKTCPYSAIKVYTTGNLKEWPPAAASLVHTKKAHMEAIRTGPYGRCVWRTDNDVVDHQVVAMEFEGKVTATFTMTGFTQRLGRIVRVNGTTGELLYDEEMELITLRSFGGGDKVRKIKILPERGGHGGGDERVVKAWLTAVTTGDRSVVLTDAQESLKTHRVVFAAEQSRREGRMVELS